MGHASVPSFPMLLAQVHLEKWRQALIFFSSQAMFLAEGVRGLESLFVLFDGAFGHAEFS